MQKQYDADDLPGWAKDIALELRVRMGHHPGRDSNGELRVNKAIFSLLTAMLMLQPVLASAQGQVGLDYWNGIDKEVVETETGLHYKVIIMGKGRKPKLRSDVSVHYRGMLLNGSVFDHSYDSDEPVQFNVRQVIDGWKEGLQLMPVGSVFVFLIPPELAYGSRGTELIPPNAPLIFEIELYDIN
jgi:FKBP-type peptidyl-prolyl cis-trans isomerase